jgi:FkbH-like protein
MLDDPHRLVVTVRSADRFGDNGLVGAAFTRRDGPDLFIDNFLLSCRVFSRGIEQACLAALLRHAVTSGASAVHASYFRTAKNRNVREFYPRYGFTVVDDDGTRVRFRHDLVDLPHSPTHIRLSICLERSGW